MNGKVKAKAGRADDREREMPNTRNVCGYVCMCVFIHTSPVREGGISKAIFCFSLIIFVIISSTCPFLHTFVHTYIHTYKVGVAALVNKKFGYKFNNDIYTPTWKFVFLFRLVSLFFFGEAKVHNNRIDTTTPLPSNSWKLSSECYNMEKWRKSSTSATTMKIGNKILNFIASKCIAEE